jgi:hypothetical protein
MIEKKNMKTTQINMTMIFNMIFFSTWYHSNDIYHQPMNWFEWTLIKDKRIEFDNKNLSL